MRLHVYIAFVLASGLGAAPSPGKVSEAQVESQVVTGTLGNGLRYIVIRTPAMASATHANLIVPAGSDREKPNEAGVAHLIEHLAVSYHNGPSGRRRLPLGSSPIDGPLPVVNGATTSHATIYEFFAKEQSWRTGLDVFRQVILGPGFSKKEFDLEKNVVIAELMRGGKLPQSTVAISQALGTHKNPILGPAKSSEILHALSYKATLKFYEDNYSINNMTLIIQTRHDQGQIIDEISKRFSDIEPRSAADVPENTATIKQGVDTFIEAPNETFNSVYIQLGSYEKFRGQMAPKRLLIMNRILLRAVRKRFNKSLIGKAGLRNFLLFPRNSFRDVGPNTGFDIIYNVAPYNLHASVKYVFLKILNADPSALRRDIEQSKLQEMSECQATGPDVVGGYAKLLGRYQQEISTFNHLLADEADCSPSSIDSIGVDELERHLLNLLEPAHVRYGVFGPAIAGHAGRSTEEFARLIDETSRIYSRLPTQQLSKASFEIQDRGKSKVIIFRNGVELEVRPTESPGQSAIVVRSEATIGDLPEHLALKFSDAQFLAQTDLASFDSEELNVTTGLGGSTPKVVMNYSGGELRITAQPSDLRGLFGGLRDALSPRRLNPASLELLRLNNAVEQLDANHKAKLAELPVEYFLASGSVKKSKGTESRKNLEQADFDLIWHSYFHNLHRIKLIAFINADIEDIAKEFSFRMKNSPLYVHQPQRGESSLGGTHLVHSGVEGGTLFKMYYPMADSFDGDEVNQEAVESLHAGLFEYLRVKSGLVYQVGSRILRNKYDGRWFFVIEFGLTPSRGVVNRAGRLIDNYIKESADARLCSGEKVARVSTGCFFSKVQVSKKASFVIQ